ncbi:MAG: P-loop NTPase [Synechococcaceae cyanobacterium SM2_3_1]|nr:P-loop NTPase [Synechococcaceae cyanobacterium SM2_3_1]
MTKIILIHSFRFGTGKSNITASLATEIAQQGRRVGIIDTDLHSPGVLSLFGCDVDELQPMLNHYLWGKLPIEDIAHDVGGAIKVGSGEVTLLSGRIFLIPSGPRVGEIARMLRLGFDLGRLGAGIYELALKLGLDYLLIDTHPGINEESLLMLSLSHTLLLLTDINHQSFQGTAVVLDLARNLGVPTIYLLINQIPADYDLKDIRFKAETAFGVPVGGLFPFAKEMLLLAGTGVFSLHYPDHPWSEQIRTVANLLLKKG